MIQELLLVVPHRMQQLLPVTVLVRLNTANEEATLNALETSAKLASVQAQPILDLGLRLGEGSGAALALPLIKLACELHAGMATFQQAAVTERQA